MSIRLRLTLLYSIILSLTLIAFGAVLYTTQEQSTLNALKSDLTRSGKNLARSVEFNNTHPRPTDPAPPSSSSGKAPSPPPPMPFEEFSGDQAFQKLREREMVRVLDANGTLVASPFGTQEDVLPLSGEGLATLQAKNPWWEKAIVNNENLLIYNQPVISGDEVINIVQVARPLTEHDRSLAALASTLLIASLVTVLVAFVIGWALSGTALQPIHHITQTAQSIGKESDFTRRVDYNGPHDEIGDLAKTFNSMLARLQEAYQNVSTALNMQRNFVADVSHELRTPLTTLRGNLALMGRIPPLPAKDRKEILSDMEVECDRLIRLVNDLLVLARADAGQSLIQKPISIQPLIEEACHHIRQLYTDRDIYTKVDDLQVSGDRDAIKQVLIILLDNANKYTRGDIHINCETQDGKILLQVKDCGPGMKPSAIEHIFDRFYRGDEHPDVPGFGLGLPIAKSLVERQGGQIQIFSDPETGSTVSLFFPIIES